VKRCQICSADSDVRKWSVIMIWHVGTDTQCAVWILAGRSVSSVPATLKSASIGPTWIVENLMAEE